jgi:hypothetical protein
MAVGIFTQIRNYIIRLLTRKVANEVIKAAGGRTTRSGSSRRSSSGSSRSTSGRSTSRNRKSFAGEDDFDADMNRKDENK